MKVKTSLLVLTLALTTLLCAQEKPAQAPSPGGSQMRVEPRQHRMEMHKQEMEAMKADIEKMKSSLAEMKANTLTTRDPNELACWRNNADLWEAMIGHMERMQKRMESMGSDMMHELGMGGPPSSPPAEKKPL